MCEPAAGIHIHQRAGPVPSLACLTAPKLVGRVWLRCGLDDAVCRMGDHRVIALHATTCTSRLVHFVAPWDRSGARRVGAINNVDSHEFTRMNYTMSNSTSLRNVRCDLLWRRSVQIFVLCPPPGGLAPSLRPCACGCVCADSVSHHPTTFPPSIFHCVEVPNVVTCRCW